MLGTNVMGWTADQATSFAVMDAFVADLFDDLGKFQTLAGRSALMGADVAVREILTLVEYDADLNGSHLYQSRAAIRNLACLADWNFRHGTSI